MIFGSMAARAGEATRVAVTVGGFMKQEVGVPFNDQGVDGARVTVDQQTDTEIWFNFRAALANGLVIDGRVELEGGAASETSRFDEVWMRVTGKFGRIIIGSEDSVAHNLPLDPPLAGLSISDAGNWVVDPTGASSGGDSAFKDNDLRLEADDPEMISYIAPTVDGLRLGVSYISNAARGEKDAATAGDSVYRNGVAVGLRYLRPIGKLRIGLGAAYQTWLDRPGGGGPPLGYTASAHMWLGGLTIGGAFVAIHDSFDGGGAERGDSQEGEGFQIGARYAWGNRQASLTYHYGEDENDPANPARAENNTLVASLRQELGPGVRLYGSAVFADFEGEAAGDSDDNRGWALVGGVRVAF